MSEYPTYLIHYGIEGQKWGVRRFQNEDGTYTEDGLVRRRKDQAHFIKAQSRAGRKFDRYTEKMRKDKAKGKTISDRRIEKATKLGTKFRSYDYMSKDPDTYLKARKLRMASLAKFGVNAATVAAGAGYIAKNVNALKELGAKDVGLVGNHMGTNLGAWHLNESKKIIDAFGNSRSVGTPTGYTKNIENLENIQRYLRNNPDAATNKEAFKKAPESVREFLLYDGQHNFESNNIRDMDKSWINSSNESKIEFLKNKNLNENDFYNDSSRVDFAKQTSTKMSDIENNYDKIKNKVTVAGVLTAVNLGRTVAELAIEQHLINKMVKTHYKESNDKARQETIKDLKKHGFQKESEIAEAKQSRIKSLLASGKTQEEVAKMLGISTSTVNKYK